MGSLDNVTAEGAEAFDKMSSIVDSVADAWDEYDCCSEVTESW